MLRRLFVHLANLALVLLATVSALLLRSNFEVSADQVRGFLPYLTATMAAAAVILVITRVDSHIWRFSSLNDYLSLLSASVAIVVCAVVADFTYNRLEDIARALPILQFILIAAFLIGSRVFYRLHRASRADRRELVAAAPVNGDIWVLLVGINPISELYVKCAQTYAQQRIGICGVISERARNIGRTVYGLPVRGGIADIDTVLANMAVQGVHVRRIIVTADVTNLDSDLKDQLAALHDRSDLDVEYFGQLLQLQPKENLKSTLASPGPGTSFWEVKSISPTAIERLADCASRSYFTVKQLIESPLAAAMLLAVTAPMIVIAIGTYLTVGAPAFFWQYRPGFRGRRFKIYKFRTMRDAYDDNGVPVPDELRASIFGSVLRKLRLDELPQLLSIARGDMSFIGPRPLLLAEQAAYPAVRLAVRPGLTGWAQVNGGRLLSFDDKLALDLWYIAHASPIVDLSIMLKTLKMLVLGDRRNEPAIREARREFGFLEASRRPMNLEQRRPVEIISPATQTMPR